MPGYYDYDYGKYVNPKRKPPHSSSKKRLRIKTFVHRAIVIISCVLIIAVIAAIINLALKLFGKKENESGFVPGALSVLSLTVHKPQKGAYPVPTAENYVLSDIDDPDYFDDAVFVGDSVSYGFELYVTNQRSNGHECMGRAQFLTSGSLSYSNLLWDVSGESVHPAYNGQKMKLEDSLPLIHPGKIYILLGSNDVATYGVNSSVEHAQTVLGNIKSACPDAAVIVLATTPKLKAAEERSGSLNNADIDAFNRQMKEKCPEQGYIWLDFASQFKLEDGTLNPDCCGDPDDMGIHFLSSSYSLWTEYFEENKVYSREELSALQS